MSTESPYTDNLKIFLDDVVYELSALMEQRPLSEKRSIQFQFLSRPAFEDIARVLEALNCKIPAFFLGVSANKA